MTQDWATRLKVQLLFREEMEAEEEPSMIRSREVMIKLLLISWSKYYFPLMIYLTC